MDTVRMPILTVIEPYATCIIHGPKRVENRTRRPPEALIGKDLAIHAGRNQMYLNDMFIMAEIQQLWPEMPTNFQQSMGCIIGVVRVTGCQGVNTDDQWSHGPHCWTLADPRAISPIPLRGRPGIFYHDLSRKEAPCLF